MALTVRSGDVVRLKKAHPCGGYRWQVGRLGADIGLTCLTCGRHILAARSYLEAAGPGGDSPGGNGSLGVAQGYGRAGRLVSRLGA